MTSDFQLPLPTLWMDSVIRVAVVGAGGTGSQVVDQLASLHATLVALGHPGFDVTVFDPDSVSEANIGRQRFCRADIGRSKSDVLIHRINLFHGLSWESKPDYYDPDFYSHLVIGCVDTVAARQSIFSSRGKWWLDCGNSARAGHVILGKTPSPPFAPLGAPDDTFRLPTWWDLFPDAEDVPDAPSCSVEEAIRRQSWPVNHRAAQLACELLYSWIRHGSLTWHGALFEVEPPSVSVLNIRPDTWWPFGLEVCPERVAGLADGES